MSKTSRKQAAKNVAKAVKNQYVDTIPSLVKTAAHAAKAAGNLAQGNVVGTVIESAKAVSNGVKTVGKTIKYGWDGLKNAFKTIFNDPKWWTRTGIQPSMNITRPMNPIFNTAITNDPTIGSVLKVVDLYLNWNGLYESEMFDTIVVKYYESIRNTVRSNLPYDQKIVKQYLINAIAIKAVAAQCKRNLAFRNFSPSESPNSYKLFRKKTDTLGGYGATKLIDIEYLQDDQIATSIVEWDTAVDIMNNIVLPPYVNDFIDHYFGLVFSSDVSNTNSQFIIPQLSNIDYYDVTTSKVTSLNANNITPANLIILLNNLLSNYGIIIADLKHSGMDLVSCIEPKYNQLDTTVYYDKSILQAICNAYTSDSALQSNEYIRLDAIDNSGDLFTTFIMMGALQKQFSSNALNLPLLTPVCMSIKIENTPTLQWEQTFTQSDLDLSTLDFFAINIVTDISEDIYVTYSSTGTTTVLNQTGQNTSGQTYKDLSVKINFSDGTYSPIAVNDDNLEQILASDHDIIYCKVPLFYVNLPGLSSKRVQIAVLVYSCTKTYSQADGNYVISLNEFKGITYEYYDDQGNIPYRNSLNSIVPVLVVDQPSYSSYTGPQFQSGAIGVMKFKKVLGIGFSQDLNINFNFTSAENCIFNPTVKIPNNNEYIFNIFMVSFASITSITASVTNDVQTAVAVSSGYFGMSEWLVQQLDFHIPMLVRHRYTVSIDKTSNSYVSGVNLLKEAYIPFWYNIQDILPVAYAMMNSLLTPLFTKHASK